MRWLDPSIIAIYIAVLAGHGIRFSRRQTSTERYFVARRGIPAWALGLSRLATLIAASPSSRTPGSAYAGEVWIARDARLDGIAAIKTSLAKFNGSRAVAALDHRTTSPWNTWRGSEVRKVPAGR